jgi:replication factor C large subunit
MLLTQKYAPKSLSQIAGNEEARKEMEKWAAEVEAGSRPKPLLLSGPPGTGKTAAARALAAQMGWELVESDASRLRSADEIKSVLGSSSSCGSLFGSRRLVIVDEIGTTSDRGSTGAIAALAKDAAQPLIFIANDEWDDAVRPLRFSCRPVAFKKVNSRSVEAFLRKVAREEALADGDYLKQIATGCGGDVRAALIDLQAFGSHGQPGSREREAGIFDAVRKALKAATYSDAVKAADGVDEEISSLVLWLAENVPNEYEGPAEVATAFSELSRADAFLWMVRRSGSYAFWRYARVLALAGAALSKEKPYYKFAKYSFPAKLSKMSSARGAMQRCKSAAAKVGARTHASARRARRDTLPYLPADSFCYYGLDRDEGAAVEEALGRLASKQ